jgi:hypothetical protein
MLKLWNQLVNSFDGDTVEIEDLFVIAELLLELEFISSWARRILQMGFGWALWNQEEINKWI